MDKLYWSKRNYLFKSEKYGWLLYAGLTNSFFKLSDELKKAIDAYKNGQELNIPQDVLAKFQKTGVLSKYTDEEFDRLYLLKWTKMQAQNHYMNLTIAPTMNCNFRCSYCYEKNFRNTKMMDLSLTQKIIDFANARKVKKLNVDWYGGEPLLGLDFIKHFNHETYEAGFDVSQSIVTNGYLLTEDVVKYFDFIWLKNIQITLDGDKKTHNNRRPHVSNPDSFERIMDNLEMLYTYCNFNGYWPNVSIRVNIDKTNEEDYPKIKNMLYKKYGNFYYVYYSLVQDSNSCVDKVDQLFNSEYEKAYKENLVKKFGIEDELFYPKQFGNCLCGAQTLNNYVIDAEGFMYKCWEDIGIKERAVYNLSDKKCSNVLVESDYILKSQAMFDNTCKNCFMFISCQGGCPRQALDNKRTCHIFKNNIVQFLERHYEKSLNKDFVY